MVQFHHSEHLTGEREDQARDDKGTRTAADLCQCNVPNKGCGHLSAITEYVNHQVGTATATATSKRKSPGVTRRQPAPD